MVKDIWQPLKALFKISFFQSTSNILTGSLIWKYRDQNEFIVNIYIIRFWVEKKTISYLTNNCYTRCMNKKKIQFSNKKYFVDVHWIWIMHQIHVWCINYTELTRLRQIYCICRLYQFTGTKPTSLMCTRNFRKHDTLIYTLYSCNRSVVLRSHLQ